VVEEGSNEKRVAKVDKEIRTSPSSKDTADTGALQVTRCITFFNIYKTKKGYKGTVSGAFNC